MSSSAPIQPLPERAASSVDAELSTEQRRIWASQQLHPDAPVANMVHLHHLAGRIEPERFVQAVDAVIRNSDALRTVVERRNGQPVAFTLDEPPTATAIVELATDDVPQWATQRAAVPIAIERSVYDSVLLQHPDGTSTWYLGIHHVAIDAWGATLVFRAAASEYAGLAGSGTATHPHSVPGDRTTSRPVEVARLEPFSLHLDRLAADVETPAHQRALAHWAEFEPPAPRTLYAAGASATSSPVSVSSVATAGQVSGSGADGAEPESLDTGAVRTTSAAASELLVGLEQVVDELRPVSRDLGVLAALGAVTAAYLSRLRGDSTVRLALPVHHRRTPRARNTIGLLMETYPFDVEVRPDDTFRRLYERTSQALFTTLRYARPGTSPPAGSDVVINVITAQCGDFGTIPAQTTWLDRGHLDPSFRLFVNHVDFDGRGAPELIFDVATSAAAAPHRDLLPAHFGAMLGAFVADVDAKICDTALLSADERRRLVEEYNHPSETARDTPASDTEHGAACTGVSERRINRHEPVSRTVLRRLTAAGTDVVLIDGGATRSGHLDGEARAVGAPTWTGAALAGRIASVAQWLRGQGVGPGDRVGVRMERSVDAVVAIHGVLTAGAAFVPIDPRHPDDRQRHIVADAELTLVIDEIPDSLPLPPPGGQPAALADAPPITPDTEAYVLYTSGSTGQPKGVPVTHAALADYLDFAVSSYVDAGERPVVAVASSLSFDLTITSLFLPFLVGGTAIVYTGTDIEALTQLAADDRPTWLKATPSHLEVLLRLLPPDHSLTTLVVGGEAFSTDLAHRLHDRLRGITTPAAHGNGQQLRAPKIFNEYGPTEAVVGCMIERFDPAAHQHGQVPIGIPAPDVELFVLDTAQQPVPAGVAGELYIVADRLTTGYLNRPDLNVERFVALPHLQRSRAYRTGDLARFDARDASPVLHYLGRVDDQMKVGGVRLEPGEIEARLQAHPAIESAVVRLQRATGGQPDALAAWYRLRSGAEPPTPLALQRHVAAALPHHAVPAAFAAVDEFPMTSSGKLAVDRLPRAQPVSTADRPDGSSGAPADTNARTAATTDASRQAAGRSDGAPAELRPDELTDAIDELTLATWRTLLNNGALTLDDDVFDAGAASLTAIEAIVTIGERLRVDLDIAQCFRLRNARQLADHARTLGATAPRSDQRAPDTDAVDSASDVPRRPRQPIPPHALDVALLSAGQEALLFDALRRRGEPVYTVTQRSRLPVGVDVERLARAISVVVGHHPPLHTAFDAERTTLAPDRAASVVIEPTPITADALDELAAAESRTGFDLTSGPLVRARIAEVQPDPDLPPERHLVLSMHHLVADAGSTAPFWNDLEAAYRGDPLPTPPTSYADHAAWQRSRCTDEHVERWVDRLASAPTGELSLRRPQPAGDSAVDGETGGYLTRRLSVGTDALDAAGTRPTAFFLGVLGELLARYQDNGRSDHGSDRNAARQGTVSVGLAASTRDHPDVGSLVGYFMTVLPLLVPGDAATPLEAAQQSEQRLAEALADRHVPMDRVEAALRTRDDDGASTTPTLADLTRTMFVYEEPFVPELGGVAVPTQIVHPGVAVAELTIFVRPVGEHFELAVEWDRRRFEDRDVEHFAAAFTALAEGAASAPSAAWATADRQWPDHPGASALDGGPLTAELRPIVEMLAAHATNTPEHIALRCGDESLTYDELATIARCRAAALADLGVCAGDRVALRLSRSVDLVATIVAAHWIGAAYVPIDPTYPAERQLLLSSAANSRLTIVDEPTAVTAVPAVNSPTGEAPTGTQRYTVAEIDEIGSALELAPLTPACTLDDAAYLIFTSGSTGQPRGVEIDQRRLAASTLARLQAYPPEHRHPVAFAMVSSFGFDSSVAGTFWTLAAGGTLVIPTDDEAHDIDALGELIERNACSHTLLVPTLYQALLGRAGAKLAGLRCVVVAGESCAPGVVTQHHDLLPHVALYNEYGPTEATVWATVHRCASSEAPVPIGRPIPSVRVAVVDRRLRSVPPGAAGELLIAGETVADGYADGADSRFVDSPTGRLYRTGDVVRLVEGELFYVGRVDHQLNIGGRRVEPGEIEQVLTALPGVSAAVVRAEHQLVEHPTALLRSLPPGTASDVLRQSADASDPADALLTALAAATAPDTVLVAYVEIDRSPPGLPPSDEQFGLSAVALRAHLRKRLPTGLVPQIIETVDELPRTAHGKVDRNAMGTGVREPRATPPGALHRDQQPSADSATSAQDSALAACIAAWGETLGPLDAPITPSTDFFAAGGDSLRAIHLVTVLEQRLGRRIPVSALLLGRTPHALARILDPQGSVLDATVPSTVVPDTALPPLLPLRHGDSTAAPLIVFPPGGGSLVVFDQLIAALPSDVPVFGFDLPGADGRTQLPTSISQLADDYTAALLQSVPSGPYRLLGWSFGGVAALEVARRLEQAGHVVELVTMIDTIVPGLQRSGRAQAYLQLIRERELAAVAHKLFDMVKWRIILRRARVSGERAAAAGSALEPTKHNRWVTIRIDEVVEQHRVEPYSGRVLFIAAEETHAWRTTEPWSSLLAQFDVLQLPGKHSGTDGLLTGERVRTIAERLRREFAAQR